MTLILCGVAPLVGSVFARTIVSIQTEGNATTYASLLPLENQSSALNTDFMMSAYGVTWLHQSLPGFVTREGALQPFTLDDTPALSMINKTWTASTTLYGTSLSCETAEVKNDTIGFTYSNKKECTTFPGAIGVAPKSRFGGLYIGYHMDQHSDYSLPGCGCPSAVNSHLFLAIWGQSPMKNPEAIPTAIFCEPEYWTQAVNATVTVPTMTVTDIVPLGPQVSLPDSHFNRTAFEYDIGTGAQPVSQRADISETTSIINQRANLAELGFNNTVTNMIGFALGLTRLDLAEYANAQSLASSFEKAHKLVHALAINQLMTNTVRPDDARVGTIRGKMNAIAVVRPLAIALEAVLGFVAFLAVGLMVRSHARPSQLLSDPASLTDLVKMLPTDRVVDGQSAAQEGDGPDAMTSLVRGRIYHTGTNVADARKLDIYQEGPSRKGKITAAVPTRSPMEPHGHGCRVRPFVMSLAVGFPFLVLLGSSIAIVVAVERKIEKEQGLPLPSTRTIVNQMVLKYVPTALAMFLKPFWLLLNRLLCVLKPYQALAKADAISAASLDIKYTSLPPQLTIWRAVRNRHYILAAVCATGLSANILATSLNGLLNTGLIGMDMAAIFKPRFSAIFHRTHQQLNQDSRYQYIAKTNISDGVPLPPWTTPDRFFVPFSLNATSKIGVVQNNKATTRGFGLQANCQPSTFNDTAFVTSQEYFFFTRERTPSGHSVACGAYSQPYGGQNQSGAALEVFRRLIPVTIDGPDQAFRTFPHSSFDTNATEEERLTCNSLLVVGFLRGNLTVSFDDAKTENSDKSRNPDILHINSLSSLWMTCRPKVLTALYDVTVDLSGHVQSCKANRSNDEDLNPFFVDEATPASLVSKISYIVSTGQDTQPYWHNDTFVDTWFAYFIKHLSNSTTFIDPTTPVPQFESVAPYVEEVYTRLSAIALSLNQAWLSPANTDSSNSGHILVSGHRVIMSRPMFIITVALLGLNMVVAVAYWAGRPQKMLPQMPYTIACVMGMFDGSSLVSDVDNEGRWSTDWRFGYGRFVGTDGNPHVGIERQPFVTRLTP